MYTLFLQLALTGAPSSSDIYVFTDALAKDIELKDTIEALISSTKSKVNAKRHLMIISIHSAYLGMTAAGITVTLTDLHRCRSSLLHHLADAVVPSELLPLTTTKT